MGKRILQIFVVLIISIFVYTIYYLYKRGQKPPIVFKTMQPITTTIYKKTVATGSVIPRKEVNMKSQVSGIIEKVMVEAGQPIKQGDVIARVKIIPNMLNLNNAESRLNQAKISYDNAKVEFDRNEKLYTQQIISKAEFQAIELKLRTSKEELDAAESNLQIIREGVAAKSGSATNTLIRSTINGMLLDVPVKEGNSVIESNTFNEGTTIATVADMGEMIFEGKVDESEVGKIKTGMDLLLTIGAIENEKFKAKLEYISPKGVTDNGAIQFKLRAAIQLPTDKFLRAGYSANADIILAQADSVLSVSEKLLQFQNDSVFVEVEEGEQKFIKRFIQTGLSDGLNIEIKSGLTKTDKIKVPENNGGMK